MCTVYKDLVIHTNIMHVQFTCERRCQSTCISDMLLHEVVLSKHAILHNRLGRRLLNTYILRNLTIYTIVYATYTAHIIT
jgi:hypothetical protein